ncbi:tRNA (adenosine(37)-N6)-threonylcarbamoyltransferase complex ATPase subunit type 1 TsaE [Campylobacter sp. VBCF_05 NA6]|uniref:tRNA (adenosine(37)-N6)-threonylcarbamoyltransferase complex ATPase subunit type 1 TsaE n=1 Tax=unclassified Campylobacter TaxID=2593542 RepID=UPI0022E9AD8C|nr:MULTISPECIES: tRNA (adenosine(37)-N6)-threonylcarbamoyltransferase complex ATPase subunit type 1 TsaE [unclassified Campylobacter]MDA3056973.1 tRNA (adenosine(37)-N6)-threonylcarbamoyltransferase complex ATPase subunit type 1 TsaE [Campylobacter sp. VBCF_04 NA7]MDA3058742.1 tRNA (adenosine(37)-N6)-threonylcarbamoyltransferase complex ATPase subunit type 1 TsaE [Campylobacter sp. VBCF_05 NA6]
MSKSFKLTLRESEISQIAEILPRSGVILLNGTLASGKTTLTKAIALSHGIDPAAVSSPTFSLMQNYGQIYHYDLYNGGSKAMMSNGLIENLFEDGLHIIEWADENLIKFIEKYELDCCAVNIKVMGDKREYEVVYA